jgi:glycosyltransferase involved in cell wall biosynthesis
MSAAGNLATLLAHRGGRPVFVSSPMGLQQSDRESALVTDLRDRFLVWRADRVLLISEEISRAVRKLHISADRLQMADVVGVDIRRFEAEPSAGAAIRREFGIDDEDELVTTIGALHPRKRHDLLVAALPRVVALRPRAHFLIVGEGPDREALTKQIEAAGMADRVLLVGQRHDVGAILSATDVYVRPGILEGFIGITALEAMAATRPVIAWETEDVRPAITGGETGILVPIANINALSDAIVGLLRDRGLAAAIAQRGRARVEKRFSLPAVAAQLETRYSEVLAGR